MFTDPGLEIQGERTGFDREILTGNIDYHWAMNGAVGGVKLLVYLATPFVMRRSSM